MGMSNAFPLVDIEFWICLSFFFFFLDENININSDAVNI